MNAGEKMLMVAAKNEILDGLCEDGGHHKQAHLERALRFILGAFGDDGKGFDSMKNQIQWEEGI